MTDKTTEDLIKSIIEIRIKPVLESHGGAIEFVSFNDGILRVELQGACKGCPGAMSTLKNNVEGFLQSIIPEIKEVREIHLEEMMKGHTDV